MVKALHALLHTSFNTFPFEKCIFLDSIHKSYLGWSSIHLLCNLFHFLISKRIENTNNDGLINDIQKQLMIFYVSVRQNEKLSLANQLPEFQVKTQWSSNSSKKTVLT